MKSLAWKIDKLECLAWNWNCPRLAKWIGRYGAWAHDIADGW